MASNISRKELVERLFQVDEFREFQWAAINDLLERKDVMICQPTGSGKSLVFLALPFFFPDQTNDSSKHDHGTRDSVFLKTSKIVLVITPLKSLMADQRCQLSKKGIKALAIDNEQEFEHEVFLCFLIVHKNDSSRKL